jgi:hypothetical protein
MVASWTQTSPMRPLSAVWLVSRALPPPGDEVFRGGRLI